MKRLMTGKQVEAAFGITRAKLKYWRAAGIGPEYFQEGRSIMYDSATIESYISRHMVTPFALAVVEERHGTL